MSDILYHRLEQGKLRMILLTNVLVKEKHDNAITVLAASWLYVLKVAAVKARHWVANRLNSCPRGTSSCMKVSCEYQNQ